jgi:MYXO-CTERM domain-containing protein
MSKRALVCAATAITFAALAPIGVAGASDSIAQIPITDPSVELETWGFGAQPNVQAAFNTPTVLFVNMDGGMMNGGCGNFSKNNCSTIIQGEIAPHPGSASDRASIVQAVRADITDFGVIAVGERPPENVDYAMVVVGTPVGYNVGNVGGVAPGIDCGNSNPNITSFSFITNGANVVATVVHQEAAHTWGLEHVDDQFDNLFPTTGGASDPKYQDRCSKIVSDTNLTPTAGQCNSVHTMFCEHSYQNSYQEMLLLFGPPIPDVTPPTVVIEAPLEGEVIDYNDTFELIITLDDDRRPQILDTVISLDGEAQPNIKFIDQTHILTIHGGDNGHGLGNGEHTIRVDIADEHGNPAFDQVNFIIENAPVDAADGDDGGDGAGGTEGGADDGTADGGGMSMGGEFDSGDADDDGGQGCACSSSPPAGAAGLLLLLLALPRPRRRRSSTST